MERKEPFQIEPGRLDDDTFIGDEEDPERTEKILLEETNGGETMTKNKKDTAVESIEDLVQQDLESQSPEDDENLEQESASMEESEVEKPKRRTRKRTKSNRTRKTSSRKSKSENKVDDERLELSPESEEGEPVLESRDDFSTLEQGARQDLKLTAAAMETSMEAMVNHWNSVKEMSNSVSQNLEKVSTLMQQFPNNYYSAMDSLIKKYQPRPNTFATKIAVGTSLFAILLSFVSLTLSQTTRQAFFDRELVLAPKVIEPPKIELPKVDPPKPVEPEQPTLKTAPTPELRTGSNPRVFFPELGAKSKVQTTSKRKSKRW